MSKIYQLLFWNFPNAFTFCIAWGEITGSLSPFSIGQRERERERERQRELWDRKVSKNMSVISLSGERNRTLEELARQWEQRGGGYALKQYECIRLRDSLSDLMATWGVHVPSDLIRMDNPPFPSIKRRDAKGSEKYARHKTDLSIDFAAAAASATLLKM